MLTPIISNFKISFDKTYKIKNFSFKSDGDINKQIYKIMFAYQKLFKLKMILVN